MRVTLGTFACFGIESRFGSETSAGVEAALRHYTRRLKSRRTPIAVPGVRDERAAGDAGAELDLDMGAEIEETLREEARGQGVPIDLLLTHAIFVYLADLDAAAEGGRAAEEDAGPGRYPRRCAFVDTGRNAAARRHVGSA